MQLQKSFSFDLSLEKIDQVSAPFRRGFGSPRMNLHSGLLAHGSGHWDCPTASAGGIKLMHRCVGDWFSSSV